jgi:polysaccharide export outer membrane protein
MVFNIGLHMKWIHYFGLALSFLLLPQALAQDAYMLQEGDVLSVSVWGEEELNREVKVLPDGSISFPLVGNIPASGTTAPELEKAVAAGISNFVPDASVSVVVVETLGNRVFLLGNVNEPGSYIMTSPLSVMQALSLAGGLGDFADENDILILRESPQGQTRLRVRYKDILSGKDLETNHQLQAGDTVMVP